LLFFVGKDLLLLAEELHPGEEAPEREQENKKDSCHPKNPPNFWREAHRLFTMVLSDTGI